MSDERPKRRHFQFSVRKLLLWTTMLALFLGVLRLLDLEAGFVTIAVCWAVVVAIVRTVRGPKTALCVSALGGALLLCATWVRVSLAAGIMLALGAPLAGIVGAIYGCWFFLLVEAALRIVRWADNLMETE